MAKFGLNSLKHERRRMCSQWDKWGQWMQNYSGKHKQGEGFCQNASGLTRFFLEAGHVISHEAGWEGICGRGGNCPGTEDGLVLRLN